MDGWMSPQKEEKQDQTDLSLYGPLPKPKVPGILPFDIQNRVENPDGTISTIKTISFNDGTGEILIPTIVKNKELSEEEAIDYYYKSGESFGTFKSVEDANRMAEYLHLLHAQRLENEKQGNK
jgi:hypothetical protein